MLALAAILVSPVVPAADPEAGADRAPLPLSRDRDGFGLFDYRDPTPLAALHLRLPTSLPRALEARDGAVKLQFDIASMYAAAPGVLVDAETYALRFSHWFAFTRNFFVGFESSVYARDEGILDPPIEDAQELFHVADRGRSDRGHNSYAVRVTDRNGSVRELDRGPGVGGGLTFRAHWTIYDVPDDWLPAISLGSWVQLPSFSPGFGSRGVDIGLQLGAQKRVHERVYLYGVGGSTYLHDHRTEGIEFEEFTYQLTIGAELVLVPNELSLVAQYTVDSPLLRDVRIFDRHRNTAGGGLRWQLGRHVHLSIGAMTSLPPYENAPDLTVMAAIELRS